MKMKASGLTGKVTGLLLSGPRVDSHLAVREKDSDGERRKDVRSSSKTFVAVCSALVTFDIYQEPDGGFFGN